MCHTELETDFHLFHDCNENAFLLDDFLSLQLAFVLMLNIHMTLYTSRLV